MEYEAYHALVQQYSKALDLFGPAVERDFIQHCRSAECYAELLPENATVLDVGSGGGLPGIVIALKRPDVQVVLCEIRKRRASFLSLAKAKLNLKNATVFSRDVRDYHMVVSWVTAQAVTDVSGLVSLVEHTVSPTWHLLTRRPRGLVVPQNIHNYTVNVQQHELDLNHELLHLTLERKI